MSRPLTTATTGRSAGRRGSATGEQDVADAAGPRRRLRGGGRRRLGGGIPLAGGPEEAARPGVAVLPGRPPGRLVPADGPLVRRRGRRRGRGRPPRGGRGRPNAAKGCQGVGVRLVRLRVLLRRLPGRRQGGRRRAREGAGEEAVAEIGARMTPPRACNIRWQMARFVTPPSP